MVGGGISGTPAKQFEAKITRTVIISCIMAATGGLMFGYDIGISGGVTSMPSFLKHFFPVVYERTIKHDLKESNYCKYNNQKLQLFTSSLYLAAMFATMFAGNMTRKFGRRPVMVMGGAIFIVGAVINAAAMNIKMLIIGRILLGIGVGFGNQAVPVFISEIAPTRLRGGLNILFQLDVTIGIFIANLVNWFTAKIEGGYGWRISLGLAAIPALMLTLGALMVDETPNSLIERGKKVKGKEVLKKIRGVDNVDPEYDELVAASEVAKQITNPWSRLFQRKTRPMLSIAIALQVFQQFTGINAIMFYAPVLFSTVGFKNDASLYSAVITGGVNVLCTLVSVYSVDKVGRRVLLLEACVQMLASQVAVAVLLGMNVTDHSDKMSPRLAILVVVLLCTFVASFAWSWGPLGWLIPSETFPLETRSVGQSVTVFSNMLFTFIIAQAFLTMLCTFKYGIFAFFSVWIVVMGVSTIFFLPETKNVPIEEMTEKVWSQHWYWKSYMEGDDEGSSLQKNTELATGSDLK